LFLFYFRLPRPEVEPASFRSRLGLQHEPHSMVSYVQAATLRVALFTKCSL